MVRFVPIPRYALLIAYRHHVRCPLVLALGQGFARPLQVAQAAAGKLRGLSSALVPLGRAGNSSSASRGLPG